MLYPVLTTFKEEDKAHVAVYHYSVSDIIRQCGGGGKSAFYDISFRRVFYSRLKRIAYVFFLRISIFHLCARQDHILISLACIFGVKILPKDKYTL